MKVTILYKIYLIYIIYDGKYIYYLYSKFKNVGIFGYSALFSKASIDFKGVMIQIYPYFWCIGIMCMIAQQRAVIPIDTIEGTHIFTVFNLIFF